MSRLEPVHPLHVQVPQPLDFCEEVTVPLILSKRTMFSICKKTLTSFTEVPACGFEFDTIVHSSRQTVSSAVPTSQWRCLRS